MIPILAINHKTLKYIYGKLEFAFFIKMENINSITKTILIMTKKTKTRVRNDANSKSQDNHLQNEIEYGDAEINLNCSLHSKASSSNPSTNKVYSSLSPQPI